MGIERWANRKDKERCANRKDKERWETVWD